MSLDDGEKKSTSAKETENAAGVQGGGEPTLTTAALVECEENGM